MNFFANTGSGAVDVDRDGVNEVVLLSNDYEPSFAAGTTTAFYLVRGWRVRELRVHQTCGARYDRGRSTSVGA